MTTVAFRCDASFQMGAGHVMRCLTLADRLRSKGVRCHFLTHPHDGHLIEKVRVRGHETHLLRPVVENAGTNDALADVGIHPGTVHSHWLDVSQTQDAVDCAAVLSVVRPDWLVVDHYAIDAVWEKALKPYCKKLMVIDDLSDRPHVCDLLLDQTYGRDAQDYKKRVNGDCIVLCGSQYALLRPEFPRSRAYSLSRRQLPVIKKLLINLGGIDNNNITGTVLKALHGCNLPDDCQINVIVGINAPWIADVRHQANLLPWPTRIMGDVDDMAMLMAESDFAIGGAGATSWERCCLGLPTIMIILADNQRIAAAHLHQAGVAICLDCSDELEFEIRAAVNNIVVNTEMLAEMSARARTITNGGGCDYIVDIILGTN